MGIFHKLLPLGESDDLPVLSHFGKLIKGNDPAAAIVDEIGTWIDGGGIEEGYQRHM